MKLTTSQLIIAALAVVLLAGGGYLVYTHFSPSTPTFAPSDTASSTDLGNGVSVQVNGGGVTVKEVDTPLPQMPSLNGASSFSNSSLPVSAQVAVAANIQKYQAALKKDPTNLGDWIILGGQLKLAGDYKGAAEDWLYVHALAPSDEISVANLGDLYMNFIKDYPNAEKYYRMAVQNKPDLVENYLDLYTLYKYLYKTGTSAAVDVLKEGLAKNPGNPDLTAHLQAETGPSQ